MAAEDRAGAGRIGSVIPALIDTCLAEVWARGGSDLLLSAGAHPLLRLDGGLQPLPDLPRLSAAATSAVTTELLGDRGAAAFRADRQLDFAFTWRDVARVRGNAFWQKGSAALALRVLPLQIPTMAQLALPREVQAWTALPRGLVIVAGPTGSGKSTTLAAMIDHVNAHQGRHVVTIEDPIEYYHRHKRGAVNQREVGIDTPSFADGLRAVLRENPDVILIGEMRDPESVQAALTIAETGHLVLATLHTNDTAQTFDRIIDVFPDDRQPQIRLQLAHTIVGVLHQVLVPRRGGGRVAAFDVLIGTQAIRNLVREGKTRQIRNVVTASRRDGMRTLEMSLDELVRSGAVDHDVAVRHSLYPQEITRPLPDLAGPPP